MDENNIKLLGDIDFINKRISTMNSDFSETFYNKDSWHLKANDLFGAANILKERIQQEFEEIIDQNSSELRIIINSTNLPSSYFLLVGFAFENLLKGIFISREPHNQESIKKMFKLGHNLLELTRYLQIDLTINEEEIINRLTNYLLWDGRYPTPKKENDFSIKRSVSLYQTDFTTITNITKKLEVKL
ncbi:hypothetical protein [Paenibacillus sp. CMAA1364]